MPMRMSLETFGVLLCFKRRWGWRLTCQTCDDGRWTQRRPPKPSSWSPSPCCCHKARGRSAGYSRCFPVYRSAISSTCPLSLSSALSSCTPEASYGTFLKVRNYFCDTNKGKSKEANLIVVPFASWGVDINRIPESNSMQVNQCRHLQGNHSPWNCSNPQTGWREKGEAGKKPASP